MTISFKHTFQSAKGDPGDTTLVRPSNWNAEHTTSMATGKVLGRATVGTGVVEELSAPLFGQSILAAADLPSLLAAINAGMFTTGDVKFTLKTTPDTTWVMVDDGSIGNASSSATNRANADTLALYTLIWNNILDTYAPVTGGRGVSAAADFAASKPMALTKMLGHALGIAGAGSGLTSRALGLTTGEEAHALISDENGPHIHTITDPGHTHPEHTTTFQAGGNATGLDGNGGTANTGSNVTGIAINSSGLGTAHNNMQPTSFLNAMVKL